MRNWVSRVTHLRKWTFLKYRHRTCYCLLDMVHHTHCYPWVSQSTVQCMNMNNLLMNYPNKRTDSLRPDILWYNYLESSWGLIENGLPFLFESTSYCSNRSNLHLFYMKKHRLKCLQIKDNGEFNIECIGLWWWFSFHTAAERQK